MSSLSFSKAIFSEISFVEPSKEFNNLLANKRVWIVFQDQFDHARFGELRKLRAALTVGLFHD